MDRLLHILMQWM